MVFVSVFTTGSLPLPSGNTGAIYTCTFRLYLYYISLSTCACIMATGGAPRPTRPFNAWHFLCGRPYAHRVLDNMKMFFQKEHFADVTLAAEGQSIPCHKLLLSAASEFFREKFVTNTDPQNQSLLDIDGMEFDILTAVVSHIYSDSIDFTGVTIGNIIKLILAGVQLKIPELTVKCNEHLLAIMQSNVEACIDVHRLAKYDVVKDLREKSWEVMTGNFDQVVASKAFLGWSEAELLQYMQEDGLNVKNENQVFEAVVAWVKYGKEARKPSFSRLAGCLRLAHCSPAFLKEVVAKEPLMESCYKLLLDALLGETPPEATQARSGKRKQNAATHHTPTDTIVILGGTANNGTKCWVLKNGEWKINAQFAMPVKQLYSFGVCLQGEDMFITGGDSRQASNKCWKFSFRSMQWTPLPDLTAARYDHASVCVGDDVYVIGGRPDTDCSMASMECLDNTDVWRLMHGMPSARSACSAVHFGGCIIIWGGQRHQPPHWSHYYKTGLCYNIATETWTNLPALPNLHFGVRVSSLVLRNTAYFMDTEYKHCMSYSDGQWQTRSGPKESMSGGKAVVWQDRILLLSWNDECKVLRVEEYNPAKDQWLISRTVKPTVSKDLRCLRSVFVMRV